MIFVGIDVAKDTHYAAVSDDSGAVLVKPFAFKNNVNSNIYSPSVSPKILFR